LKSGWLTTTSFAYLSTTPTALKGIGTWQPLPAEVTQELKASWSTLRSNKAVGGTRRTVGQATAAFPLAELDAVHLYHTSALLKYRGWPSGVSQLKRLPVIGQDVSHGLKAVESYLEHSPWVSQLSFRATPEGEQWHVGSLPLPSALSALSTPQKEHLFGRTSSHLTSQEVPVFSKQTTVVELEHLNRWMYWLWQQPFFPQQFKQGVALASPALSLLGLDFEKHLLGLWQGRTWLWLEPSTATSSVGMGGMVLDNTPDKQRTLRQLLTALQGKHFLLNLSTGQWLKKHPVAQSVACSDASSDTVMDSGRFQQCWQVAVPRQMLGSTANFVDHWLIRWNAQWVAVQPDSPVACRQSILQYQQARSSGATLATPPMWQATLPPKTITLWNVTTLLQPPQWLHYVQGYVSPSTNKATVVFSTQVAQASSQP
jgi:hypothetical protein